MSDKSRGPAEREVLILERLKEHGYVNVSDLSEWLDVSEVTIRKDLQKLEGRNLLHRTYGGANLRDPYVRDRPLDEKVTQHTEEKRRIGKAAAQLVADRDSIILASGTTMTQVARHLRGTSELTVVTSAMNVALEVAHLEDVEVIMLGGMVRRTSKSVVGPYAQEMIREYACDTLFLGVDGFDLEHGLSTANAPEAHLNQFMIRAAQRVIIVTDSSKFGLRSLRRICGIDAIHRVITDKAVDDRVVSYLKEQGVYVDVV
ncbi:MAG: DeoR/GlpR family DNA-binding transcription regulator [Longimonas sp.]|uniref:DeoR/GlpR family DNA-binding transcription regulator n=1 Tax=Longimonas sp. TaxID=2039626 RepID=UPI00334950C5